MEYLNYYAENLG